MSDNKYKLFREDAASRAIDQKLILWDVDVKAITESIVELIDGIKK